MPVTANIEHGEYAIDKLAIIPASNLALILMIFVNKNVRNSLTY